MDNERRGVWYKEKWWNRTECRMCPRSVSGSRHRDQNIIVSPTKPRVGWSQLRSNLASFSFMSLWIVGGPRAATQATHTRPVKWRNKILIFSPPTRFSRHLYFIWRELKGFSLRWQEWKVSWFQMTRQVYNVNALNFHILKYFQANLHKNRCSLS